MREKSFQNLILILFIVSIIFIIVYLFFLIDIPEIINKGYEIGLLIFNLSLSFIAAAIFYYIVDYFPKRVRKRELLKSLEIHIYRIEEIHNKILQNLNYHNLNISKIDLTNIEKKKLKMAMNNTPLDFKTEVNTIAKSNLNILELIKGQKGRVEKEISELEKHIDFLSTDLYKSLVELKGIDVTLIFTGGIVMIQRVTNQKVNNLGIFSDELFRYVERVKLIRQEWELNKQN